MNPDDVAAAVQETGRMLRADGGDLLLLEANPKTARIHLKLELDNVSCEECVMPPDALHGVIEAALQRSVPGEFELIIDDPRRGGIHH
jgi:Fe-S cluster biogenesis protein NfuA